MYDELDIPWLWENWQSVSRESKVNHVGDSGHNTRAHAVAGHLWVRDVTPTVVVRIIDFCMVTFGPEIGAPNNIEVVFYHLEAKVPSWDPHGAQYAPGVGHGHEGLNTF